MDSPLPTCCDYIPPYRSAFSQSLSILPRSFSILPRSLSILPRSLSILPRSLSIFPFIALVLLILPGALLPACGDPSGDDDAQDTPDTTPTPAEETPIPYTCAQVYTGPEIEVDTDGRFEILENFPSSLLENTRNIRIYLPESYGTDPALTYPVLYMHDGQNLYDDNTAAYGTEWQVDENVDALVAAGTMAEILVVGIDNTSARMDEYTPSTYDGYGGGDGDLYAHFIMDELKPYIDTYYPTTCGAPNTAVMGSSLGGLISFYIGWNYPEVFGLAGCMSSSFWWGDNSMHDMVEADGGANPDVRFWIDVGTAEGSDDDGNGLTYMVDDARAMRDLLRSRGYVFEGDLGYQEAYGQPHNEGAWAARVANPLLFFFGVGSAPSIQGIDIVTYGTELGLEGMSSMPLEVNSSYANSLEMTVPNDMTRLQSRAPEVVQVSSDGMLSAVSAGEAEITADYEGQSASTTVEVVEDLPDMVTVTFDVTVPDWTPKGDSVYIVGDQAQLGAWNPGAVPMNLLESNRWSLAIEFQRNSDFLFKFTRGSWSSVEKDANGDEISDRQASAEESKILDLVVENWADVQGE